MLPTLARTAYSLQDPRLKLLYKPFWLMVDFSSFFEGI